MFIDLLQVPPEGQGIDRSYDAVALGFETAEFRMRDGVRVTGRLSRADDGAFRLSGRLEGTVELSCVRCLDPVLLHLRLPLDLVYLPQAANVGPLDEERELADEDMAVSFYRDDRIDLKFMIWEQVNLALPMKPLCRDECRGLCPECGTNRNLADCECVVETVDPRLSILKTLLSS